jgi:hypothetical protein
MSDKDGTSYFLQGWFPCSLGQNLALSVFHVPRSLDNFRVPHSLLAVLLVASSASEPHDTPSTLNP